MPEGLNRPNNAGSDTPFLTDVQTLRQRARQHIEQGAVTATYGADRDTVVKVLNEALATEIVCTLRYRRHYYMAQGIASESVKSEFLAHANEEQAHADQIAERIVQLGGEPDLNPENLAMRSHAQYVEGDWKRFVEGATRYLAVTAADVQRVAKKYLIDRNLTIVTLAQPGPAAPPAEQKK